MHIYIYIYIYTRTSRPFGPLVLVVAFGLHRGLRPLPPPKKISKRAEKWENKIDFFLHFSMLLDISGCLGTFLRAGGGQAPCGGRRPPKEQEARRASMFLNIYIY